jgi:gluconokinase
MPIGADGTADAHDLAGAVDSVIDGAMEQAGPGARGFPDMRVSPAPAPAPAAVAVSCAWHGLVGLAADGSPATTLSTWQHTGPEVEGAAADLRRRLPDPEAVARRTGAPVHPAFPAARLVALAASRPEAVAATVRWCSTAEWLESRWFPAAPGPSSSMASATGCWDQEAEAWDGEVLAAIGVAPGALAPVDDRPRSGLAAPYRKRWPPLDGVPWMPALGDGACALVGTGCSGSRAALTVGTSAAVRVLAPPSTRAGRPAALFAYLLDPARLVLGAAPTPGTWSDGPAPCCASTATTRWRPSPPARPAAMGWWPIPPWPGSAAPSDPCPPPAR